MTGPLVLFLYLLAVAGGVLCIGAALLVLAGVVGFIVGGSRRPRG